jgi:thioredoxin-dependent peroxiredoxin
LQENVCLWFQCPARFTTVCSVEQRPAFEVAYDQIRALGIDEIYVISVNDAFIMYQWAQHLGMKKIKLNPEGSGYFTRRMGMLIEKDHLGFGWRS